MSDDFILGVDSEEIKHFLHGLGLIPLEEYFKQMKQILKRRGQSSKILSEQMQRKLAENGIGKDDLAKNIPFLYPRKRTSFSPVITRKRGRAIKKRTPSASPVITVNNLASSMEKVTDEANSVDNDQPLDLRLRTKSANQS